jgi:hypothetical protein
VELDWDKVKGCVVRIENMLGSFQGIIISPNYVLTACHGEFDSMTEFNVYFGSGETRIMTLHFQEFVPFQVDIALFRLRGGQPNFGTWITLADHPPPLAHDIFAVCYLKDLSGVEIGNVFALEKSSVIAYQDDQRIAYAQYYAMDGVSGSGIVASCRNGSIQVVGVHCGCGDATTAPPQIVKKKGGAVDFESVSDSSSHLSKKIHGHMAFCFFTVVTSVSSIVQWITMDLASYIHP